MRKVLKYLYEYDADRHYRAEPENEDMLQEVQIGDTYLVRYKEDDYA